MRCLISILLACCALCCYAQKTTQTRYLDKHLAFTRKSNSTYTAVATPEHNRWRLVATYPSSVTLLEAYFADSRLTIKDGPFVMYYLSGHKAIEGTYANNFRTGLWRSWFTNGSMKDSGMIVRDILTGRWQSWYENGTLLADAGYQANPDTTRQQAVTANGSGSFLQLTPAVTVMDGLYRSWHDNGLPKDSGAYVLDRRNGYWASWYKNGNRESQGFFRQDTLEGKWTFYREDGSISTKEQYHQNKLTSLACYDEKESFTGTSCSVAKPPVLLGSPYDWQTFINMRLQWSRKTLQTSPAGTVTIRLAVGKEGKLAGYDITSSPDELVSEDVKKVLEQMTDWSPAILHNRPLAYTLSYTIYFYPQ